MAHSKSHPQTELVIHESDLTDWEPIGGGGFGQVNRVRHKQWCFDVAIKLLWNDDGSGESLLHEVQMMRQGSCPYVIQVLGLFQGQPPSGKSNQLGLVMELMERGSLASLQKTLGETPPWPLVFRLAYHVALGINFLHSQKKPLLHLDLKPSNVLLDSCLNAKLADFGLAKLYHSVSFSKKDRPEGGTTPYMPPEAFNTSYKPKQASDIYSYGILLWSIATSKKPYEYAMSSLVKLKIPQNERPPLTEINEKVELAGLIKLMQKCWNGNSELRPSSQDCATEAESLYTPHKRMVTDAVCAVLNKMDENEKLGIHPHVDSGINVPTGRFPVQEEAGGWRKSQRDASRLKDQESARVSTCSAANGVDPTAANPTAANPTAANPTAANQTAAKPGPPSRSSARQRPQQPLKHHNRDTTDAYRAQEPPLHPNNPGSRKVMYERQMSSPSASQANIVFNQCNVTGVQQGNNNVMNIGGPQRRRHPTEPGRVKPRY